MWNQNRNYEKNTINQLITIREIETGIQSLKNNKNTGPDLIKNKFIKYGVKIIKNS